MEKFAVEIRWALVFGAMSLLWMMLEKMAGLHDQHIAKHAIYTNLVAIPAIAVYVFALRDKAKESFGGNMNFRQGFYTGLWITFFVTLLSPITQLITSLVITPNFFQNAIQYAVESKTMTQDQAEQYFSLKNYLIQGLFGAPVMGILTSAIVAFVLDKTRKKK